MADPVDIIPEDTFGEEELRELYSSVGWEAYTSDVPGLMRAVANSTFTVSARSRGLLIGLARCLSDDTSIFYLQDILVRPDFQHRGIGRQLLQTCLNRFAHVRQKVLLTDDQPGQHRFYEAMGFSDTSGLTDATLHTFVQLGPQSDIM